MSELSLFPEINQAGLRAPRIVNVACVPQRSPFRYPGGKTWLVPLFRRWISSLKKKPKCLIEPFAGGSTISLTSVFENLTQRALMVEMDKEMAAAWQTIIGNDREWLAKKILNFDLTRENAITEIGTKRKTIKEIAFRTILKNRTFHGGILAEGAGFVKNGENGKGILSRWYPQTIARRIRNIGLVAHKIDFVCGDGLEALIKNKNRKDIVYFIDPPYTAGGKKAGSRLYNHYELDHRKLFDICGELSGDFLMTYDNAPEVQNLAKNHGFQMKPVAMKNTHHAEMTELLIGRDLSWLKEDPLY
ncbi:MAG: DNA adenine methylase [Elusimicrobia bacterium]|nr:DNA adenine methylase [Elusimicrobiota bacterium]